ncbi:MAB_1171c family putative transporter [Streptomyces sp. NPDC127079]|uniref:MAB_1171c family putative transporter n=1 Tax=Streptomyces sp. NPDC127079 TaxID=3347132 RepID=UPI003665FFF7
MSGLINYGSCSVLWVGLAPKLRDLLVHRRDPYLRAITAVLALASLCFLLGAPPTVGVINEVGHVPNLAAPLTYASITAYSASSLVLVVYWQGGPRVHRTARCWMLSYAAVIVAIGILFALGDAATERRSDFDTYYATTPFIGEMIVLYLVAHLTAVTVTGVRALRWARAVTGRLRVGLVTLGVGTITGAGYSVCKLVAVAARGSGRDWSVLSTDLSPGFAGIGAFLSVTGVLLPLLGRRLTHWYDSWRTYRRLRPLERELADINVRRSLRMPRPLSPGLWLTWRETNIHNGLKALEPHLDHDLFDRVYARESRQADGPRRAGTAALAVTVATAVRRERAGRPAFASRTDHLPLQLRVVKSVTDLVHVADALADSAPASPALPASPSAPASATSASAPASASALVEQARTPSGALSPRPGVEGGPEA